MTKTLLGALAVGAILVAACSDSGDDGGGGAQREVADMLADVLDEQGVAFDEDCIRDVTSQLSDEDAELPRRRRDRWRRGDQRRGRRVERTTPGLRRPRQLTGTADRAQLTGTADRASWPGMRTSPPAPPPLAIERSGTDGLVRVRIELMVQREAAQPPKTPRLPSRSTTSATSTKPVPSHCVSWVPSAM